MSSLRLPPEHRAPLLWIALLALLVAAPQLAGWLKADPALIWGGMTLGHVAGWVRGSPYIDPNYGFTTQALGYRAALDWISGTIPWWNPYSGVGMPLAGEYQPAAFFPLTLLLVLGPKGLVLQHVALQVLSGWGVYGLLRELRVGRQAATAGGLLFAFNGTLAWFAHGPAQPLAFMPWMLWGIERARVPAANGSARGWRMFGLALAMSLLAGFPETAYIDGLLALAWAVLRLAQAAPGRRLASALPIVLGGVAGLLVAAPQILSFAYFLKDADIGGHAEAFANVGLWPTHAIPSLVAPYAYGPVFGYLSQWPETLYLWGGIGGYASLALVCVAAYGFLVARDRLRWLLLAWTLAALAKVFAIEPFLSAWNLIPGIAATAFFRYAQPSCELAMVVMAAWAIDDVPSRGRSRRKALLATGALAGAAGIAALAVVAWLWPHMREHIGLRNCALFSLLWAAVAAVGCLSFIARASSPGARAWLGRLLVADAILLFAFPTLANPRAGEIDHAAVAFLRERIGLQRFYSLGPFAPNYGAYFGIASIDHNYLPVSRRWTRWVLGHLDGRLPDPVVFNGTTGDGIQALRTKLGAYEWVGVKYVLVPPGSPALAPGEAARVYGDAAMDIYELPDPAPYFEAIGGPCRLQAASRERLRADCDAPARLVRRELFFHGWEATVDRKPVRIDEHLELFQRIELPAGRSDVAFRYAPPHSGWAWLAAVLGLGALAIPWPRRRPAFKKSG